MISIAIALGVSCVCFLIAIINIIRAMREQHKQFLQTVSELSYSIEQIRSQCHIACLVESTENTLPPQEEQAFGAGIQNLL